MNGLELARDFYAHCRPLLQAALGDIWDKACVGLVGEGSECFGLDDALSRDHDFGPCFCLWLDEAILEREKQRIQAALAGLPESFAGYRSRLLDAERLGRVGALATERFYRFFLGRSSVPETYREWLAIAEDQLACSTNGEIFEEHASLFSEIRRQLLCFYPREILLTKLAASCLSMAQAGQYNYPRSLARGEAAAAFFALSRFAESALAFVYLINGRYRPFYKHAARLAKQLPLFGERITKLLSLICEVKESKDEEEIREGIEDFAQACANYLREQGLSRLAGNWLWDQAGEIMGHVHDKFLRSQNLLRLT